MACPPAATTPSRRPGCCVTPPARMVLHPHPTWVQAVQLHHSCCHEGDGGGGGRGDKLGVGGEGSVGALQRGWGGVGGGARLGWWVGVGLCWAWQDGWVGWGGCMFGTCWVPQLWRCAAVALWRSGEEGSLYSHGTLFRAHVKPVEFDFFWASCRRGRTVGRGPRKRVAGQLRRVQVQGAGCASAGCERGHHGWTLTAVKVYHRQQQEPHGCTSGCTSGPLGVHLWVCKGTPPLP